MKASTLNLLRTAPYTIVISALLGFAVAPGIIQMWTEGLRWYDATRPVVRMKAEVIEREENSITLRLTGEKLRNCAYLGLYAYGVDVNGVLHDVYREKVDVPENRTTRPVGVQDFGDWKVWPVRFASVTMYSRHDCDGRVVLTKLFDMPMESTR